MCLFWYTFQPTFNWFYRFAPWGQTWNFLDITVLMEHSEARLIFRQFPQHSGTTALAFNRHKSYLLPNLVNRWPLVCDCGTGLRTADIRRNIACSVLTMQLKKIIKRAGSGLKELLSFRTDNQWKRDLIWQLKQNTTRTWARFQSTFVIDYLASSAAKMNHNRD